MLAAYLDVGGRLHMEGEKLEVQGQLKGLRLETVIDIDSGSAAKRDAKQKGKGKSTTLKQVVASEPSVDFLAHNSL